MSMSVKRINPPEIRAYGTFLNGKIDSIFTTMNALCNAVVEVQYYGANAFKFKTQASTAANDMATKLQTASIALAANISAATTRVGGTLGGESITIDLADNKLTLPTPQPDAGIQEVDPAALSGLTTTVTDQFTQLLEAVNSLGPRLEQTDWKGDARDGTLAAVQGFAKTAATTIETTQTSINDAIKTQVDLVNEADVAPQA